MRALRKCTSPRPRLPAYYSGTVGVPHQNRPCLTCASCHLSQSRLRTREPRQSLYLPKSHPRPSRLNQRSEAPSQDSPLTFSLDFYLASHYRRQPSRPKSPFSLDSLASRNHPDTISGPSVSPRRCSRTRPIPQTSRSYRHCCCHYHY